MVWVLESYLIYRNHKPMRIVKDAFSHQKLSACDYDIVCRAERQNQNAGTQWQFVVQSEMK